MLLSLAQWLQTLSPDLGFLRVFQYLTLRAVMAALTALMIGLLAGPFVIRRLIALKIGQPIREYAMQTHLTKSGTPTMGGVLILMAIGISTLLWFDLANRFVWIVLLVMGDMGEVGDQGRQFQEEAGRHARALGISRLFTLGEQSRVASAAFGDGRHFNNMAELIAAVVIEMPQVASIVVKGSRFMKMERVVQAVMAAGDELQKEDKKPPHVA